MEYVHQLERVVCPPEEGSEVRPAVTEQQLRKAIAKKLVACKCHGQAKGRKFNLKVDHILHLIASSYISFSRVGKYCLSIIRALFVASLVFRWCKLICVAVLSGLAILQVCSVRYRCAAGARNGHSKRILSDVTRSLLASFTGGKQVKWCV